MYKINPALEPRCTHDDNMIKNNIQLGATGDVRPCNFYGSRLNWQKLEKWCEQKAKIPKIDNGKSWRLATGLRSHGLV